jgi:hypothetical protein
MRHDHRENASAIYGGNFIRAKIALNSGSLRIESSI